MSEDVMAIEKKWCGTNDIVRLVPEAKITIRLCPFASQKLLAI